MYLCPGFNLWEQIIAAPRTKSRFGLMVLFTAHRAIMFELVAAHGIGQLGGEDAGGHGDDRVTGDHHQRGQDLPQGRLGHDVAEADRGQGDDGPVDPHGNAGEAVFRAFDDVHQGAEHDDQGRNAGQEDDDLLFAAAQCRQQVIGLGQVRTELEYPEYPQHAHDTHDQQILGVAVVDRQDAGHDGQQVDQSIEAEGVFKRFGRAVQAQQVFHGKHRRKAPFDVSQQVGIVAMDAVDTVDDDNEQAAQNDDQQGLVEASTGLGIALENNDAQFFPTVGGAVHDVLRFRYSDVQVSSEPSSTPRMTMSLINASQSCCRSEEHTSELQSHSDLVCRLLLEKKKKNPDSYLRLKKKKKHTKTS